MQDRRPRLQLLEDRRVLSISPPVFDAGQATLVITGGDLDDTVVVSESAENATIVVQQYESGQRLTTTYPIGSVTTLRFFGNAGHDRLVNDTGIATYAEGGEGNDTLIGGSGPDRLSGGIGSDRLEGRDGDDALNGDEGADALLGHAGNDRLQGGDDNDLMYGGSGDDWLYGEGGNDQLHGEDGKDYLNGGADNDRLYGGAGADFLNGSSGDDRLEGYDGDDTLRGEEGDDVLFGDAGDDRLHGGDDNDLMYGGSGDDWMYGEGGVDLLHGEEGKDYLNGGADNDRLYGGADNDFLNGSSGGDRLEGHEGDDTLRGEDGIDVLLGDAGADQLDGGDGDDLLYGGAEDDRIHGGGGSDLLYGEDGDDNLNGGDADDRLYGGGGSDVLDGGGGADRLEGEADDDILLGSDGADNLIGGEGRDIAIGGGGADTLSGSEGEDILIGGSTAFDNQTTTLREALATWNSNLTYEERIGLLSGSGAGVRFTPHETVFADLDADDLFGGADADWFVLTAVNGVYNPLGVSPHHAGMPGSMHHSVILLATPPALEGFALIDSMDHLEDRGASEVVDTAMAHATDASKLGEHLRLFQLVRYADVTHQAVRSGAWADPGTWENGRVPTTGARVLIPLGATVNLASRQLADISTVRVDGTLAFSAEHDSELRVDTLVVTETGSFQMGSAEAPIQPGVTAKLLITDTGPIDRQADPFGLGRGLVTHGQVIMHGAEVTPFVAASAGLLAGTSTLRLASAPTGWSVGDQIAIAGTAVGGGHDEVRVIRAILGATVFVDPLEFDHLPIEAGLGVHVANLSRNAVIASEASLASRLGHVMFMHNRDVHISNAAFNGLGRTDKSIVATDPAVDADWNLIGDTGDNPRARYSVHFHRNGVRSDSPPATVSGSVVNGSPGWGFVNHSSYVNFTDNVAYGVEGAAFVAEAGDEIGLFDGNLALHTTGTSEDVDARVAQQDFGFNGDGFWMQSPGVTVTDNIASGSTGSAFIYYTRGLRLFGHEIQFLAENLRDPGLASGADTLPVIDTPIAKFEGNVGYASRVGLTVRYNLRDASHSGVSVVSDSVFWNNQTGVDLPYAHNAVVRDLVVLVDPASDAINGVSNNSQTRDVTYEDLRIEGYQRALIAPLQGKNVIDGGRFVSKSANILIKPADAPGLEVLVTGVPSFASVAGWSATEVSMKYQTDNAARNPSHVFHEVDVTLQYGQFSNHRLYFHQQQADAIPFPTPLPGLSQQYVGLTQAELFAHFNLAVGGEIAPAHAGVASGVFGLVAPARTTLPRT